MGPRGFLSPQGQEKARASPGGGLKVRRSDSAPGSATDLLSEPRQILFLRGKGEDDTSSFHFLRAELVPGSVLHAHVPQ